MINHDKEKKLYARKIHICRKTDALFCQHCGVEDLKVCIHLT